VRKRSHRDNHHCCCWFEFMIPGRPILSTPSTIFFNHSSLVALAPSRAHPGHDNQLLVEDRQCSRQHYLPLKSRHPPPLRLRAKQCRWCAILSQLILILWAALANGFLVWKPQAGVLSSFGIDFTRVTARSRRRPSRQLHLSTGMCGSKLLRQ
jgi:hypothetical protein